MVKVKSRSQIEANYKSGASVVRARYEAGTADANWRDPSIKGQALYVTKMSDPTVLARREAGIAKVSDTEFRTACKTKGAPVIQQRMINASGKQATNFEPYRVALEGLTLPDKVGDPLQDAINRVGAVVKTMVNTKYPGTY